MRTITAVALVALLAGCATTPQSASSTGEQTFVGEVWTWSQEDGTVTLWKDGQRIRVKTTPEQMRTLQLHSMARITGTLAPPSELHTVTPTGPVNAVPKGQPETTELRGTVTSADANGRLAVSSDRGPVHVWAATGADQRFQKDRPVTVKISVQPVDLVPATSAAQPTPTPVGAPSASVTSEPGDHSVITGHVIGANPGGVLIVESPTGPIQVLVADSARYKVGQPVQVRTSIRTAS